ncbi:HdeD family acid-resistance protein [Flexivirga meconopsidis]|uniref:HdeD family acid-resistance protein n=1 Tax=Flexivirga meconopsidis TaxID=2977121 RepID=UPI00223F14E7|nr:DUF308 domain-containing protein [Flexivirga meconopsidis]
MAASVNSVETPVSGFAEHGWKLLVGLGLLGIVVGVLVLAWPGRSIELVGLLFGVYLVVSGVIEVVIGLVGELSGPGRVLLIVSGGLSLVVGAVAFRGSFQSVLLLAIWIGIGWIMYGVSRLVDGLASTRPGSGWDVLAGVFLLIGGFVMLATPFESLSVLVLVAAIFLVVGGVAEVARGLRLRSALRQRVA